MREIKFRGMALGDGKWIHGDVHFGRGNKRAHIHPEKGYNVSIEVDPETVGQYIDRKDKNGTEIYEGDKTNCGTVEWCECLNWDGGGSMHPGFYFKEKYEHERGELSYHDGFDDDVEVLSNIHENSELLKGEK